MYLTDEDRLMFNVIFVLDQTDPQFLAGLFGLPGTYKHYNSIPNFSLELLPDFCLNCLYDYGEVVGGHARRGCPNCRASFTVESSLYKRYQAWNLLQQGSDDLLLCYAYKRYITNG